MHKSLDANNHLSRILHPSFHLFSAGATRFPPSVHVFFSHALVIPHGFPTFVKYCSNEFTTVLTRTVPSNGLRASMYVQQNAYHISLGELPICTSLLKSNFINHCACRVPYEAYTPIYILCVYAYCNQYSCLV